MKFNPLFVLPIYTMFLFVAVIFLFSIIYLLLYYAWLTDFAL